MKNAVTVEVYGLDLDTPRFVNPQTYKGRGRPRKSDYVSLIELDKARTQIAFNRMGALLTEDVKKAIGVET